MKKLILPIIFVLSSLFFLPQNLSAQEESDCRKIFDKESYKCLGVSGDCQRECSEQTKRPDGGTYFNSGEIYSKCTRASDCDGKGQACNEQALANFKACRDAREVDRQPKTAEVKRETSIPDGVRFLGERTFQIITDWTTEVKVIPMVRVNTPPEGTKVVPLKGVFRLLPNESQFGVFEPVTGKDLEETINWQPIITKEAEQKVWDSLANFTSSAQNDIIVVKGKIKVKSPTLDDFIQVMPEEKPVFVTYFDAVVTGLDPEPTQLGYPWGPDAGAIISLPQNTEIELGANTRSIKLNRGEIEVKIQNNDPQNPFKVYSGSLTVVAPRTHFWVSQSEDNKIAVIGVYEGEVEVKTSDGKTAKVSPDDDPSTGSGQGKPGVVIVSRKLSAIKLAVAGVVLAGVIGAATLILRRKFAPKGSGKKKK